MGGQLVKTYRCEVVVVTEGFAYIHAESLEAAQAMLADGDYTEITDEEIVDIEFRLNTLEDTE